MLRKVYNGSETEQLRTGKCVQIKFRTEILCCKPERKIKFTKATVKDLADYIVELPQLEIPEESVVIV